jgi:adenine-specific DNA-methyltransferase
VNTQPAASIDERARAYEHQDQVILRPNAGTQVQFKKRLPPKKYRFDSSLSPALEWDGQSGAREFGEWLITQIGEAAALVPPHQFGEKRKYGDVVIEGLADAVDQLKKLSRPFLNWAGKAERVSVEVPTVPLFVHERLSTKAILETLKAHERDRQMELRLFGDPQLSLAQQLEAYEHTGGWVNRLILGDSLVAMNSLLEYEGLGGQVQMIYMDPPYGVEFGSNFQPFVRRRSVTDGADADLTREPEMVKAYRDTWEVGVHSYLTYLRDRLLLARELLAPSGSVFVQMGDENLHLVRNVLDDVFGSENHVVTIVIKKKGGQRSGLLDPVNDYVLWYSRASRSGADAGLIRFRPVFEKRELDRETLSEFRNVELSDGSVCDIASVPAPDESGSIDYRLRPERLLVDHPGARLFASNPLTSGGERRNQSLPFSWNGKTFSPGQGNSWKHTVQTDDGSEPGMTRLAKAGRLIAGDSTWRFKRYLDDFPFKTISNWWDGLGGASDPIYVVQTNTEIVKRCLLMTTDPGDLVLDPTCGSGTTAYVAEQWGRRWITIDASRVPLALARQRLLTATFPYYQLRDPGRGPAGGFHFASPKGIVSHVTSTTIANSEPPAQEVITDQPDVLSKVTRVTGPFCVEATIPTPLSGDDNEEVASGESAASTDRLLEALRRNPVLQLAGKRTITLSNVRAPAKALTISAEASLDGDGGTVALVFGPENAAISERLVFEGAREAHARSYARLIVIGFAIEAAARELIEKCADLVGIPAAYVQATPDLVLGDLLKTMRSSQIFSVTGLPDVAVKRLPPDANGLPERYQVELRGLDIFDPASMASEHRSGGDVPAWFLDTDYNDLCFLVSQAFFPRTSAWENLKKALRGGFDDTVWDHLAGTTSAPFVAGERRRVAVKVIDDRGNELLVVRNLDDAR